MVVVLKVILLVLNPAAEVLILTESHDLAGQGNWTNRSTTKSYYFLRLLLLFAITHCQLKPAIPIFSMLHLCFPG